MKLLIAILVMAFPMVAFGQESQPTIPEVNLEQCVAYFTKGGIAQWIGGGLVVVTTILGTFTKQSWIGIFKSIGQAIRGKKG